MPDPWLPSLRRFPHIPLCSMRTTRMGRQAEQVAGAILLTPPRLSCQLLPVPGPPPRDT